MPESRYNQKLREELRQAVEGRAQLQCIFKSLMALESGVEQVRADGIIVERPLDKSRVAALSAALNTRLRLLAKVLPDLKAVEMELGENTLGAVREFNSIERAARVAFLLERLRADGAGPDTEGRDSHMDPASRSAERRPSFLS